MFKTRKKISTFVKIVVSLLAIYYLIHYFEKKTISIALILELNLLQILSLFLLSFINWSVEIRKWQFLASNVKHINLCEASKQSLISFALSLLTPNRVGELGIKTLFFVKSDAKKIFSLSLIGTITQMLSSLSFGLIGLLVLFVYKPVVINELINKIGIRLSALQLVLVVLAMLVFIVFLIFGKKNKLLLSNLPIWIKTFGFSLIRYLVFSIQFLYIYNIFSGKNNFFLVYIAITLTYLVSTIIPMLAFMDWAVKGSVALSVFSLLHLQVDIAIVSVAIMWFLNFFVPFVVGFYLLWQWKKD